MFFSLKRKKIDQLIERVNKEREAIAKFITIYGNSARYCSIQHGPCNTEGFYLWEKDNENKYTFANEKHCLDFCKLPEKCNSEIIGKTDIELLNTYVKNTGKKHTFIKTCKVTDDIVFSMKSPVRFIEIGYIGNVLKLFDVTKTPGIIDGKYVGYRGIGMDITKQACQTEQFLTYGLKSGFFKNIHYSQDSAVYQYENDENTKVFLTGFPR